MGRRIRSRLDLLLPDLTSVVQDKQLKQKQAHDKKKPDRNFIIGDTVFAEDFTASSEKWLPGVVQKVTGPLSYQIELSNGQIVRRHIDSIRARVVSNDQAEVDDNSETTAGNFEWELTPDLSTENPETVSNSSTPDTESSIVQPDSEPPVRRSTRNRQPPSRFELEYYS